jgi:hypothetical protein
VFFIKGLLAQKSMKLYKNASEKLSIIIYYNIINMKNTRLLLLLFISLSCFALCTFGQQKTKTKTDVPVIVDQPKTVVPIIKDKPKTNVPIITDDDLLEIKSNEPDPNDLLDITVPVAKPASPNAGQQIGKEIGLTGNFTFNKKVGFYVSAPEGNLVSYFYLNTKNGYAMLDNKGMQELAGGEAEGEMTQIKNANNDFYGYNKSSEGSFVIKMGSGMEMVIHDIETGNLSEKFFKTFKKTGNKVGKTGGNKYPRVEYAGTFEGEKMSIWLSDPQDVLIDTRFTYSLNGYWGLGFIASPSGKTYMVTGIEGNGAGIFMTYIENANVSFSGVGYKPMGEMLAEGIAKGKVDEDIALKEMYAAANAEKDPQLRSIMMQQIEQYKKMHKKTTKDAEKFAKTSDMGDMPYINDIHSEEGAKSYYDMMLLVMDQRMAEYDLAMKEAQKSKDTKLVKQYSCLIGCNQTERARWENLKTEHVKILKQYKNDDDKRDEKINELMMTAGQPKACNCD